MMDIREFTEKLKDEIREYLPDDMCRDVEICDAGRRVDGN